MRIDDRSGPPKYRARRTRPDPESPGAGAPHGLPPRPAAAPDHWSGADPSSAPQPDWPDRYASRPSTARPGGPDRSADPRTRLPGRPTEPETRPHGRSADPETRPYGRFADPETRPYGRAADPETRLRRPLADTDTRLLSQLAGADVRGASGRPAGWPRAAGSPGPLRPAEAPDAADNWAGTDRRGSADFEPDPEPELAAPAPVFVDHSGRRRRMFGLVALISGSVLVLAILALVAGFTQAGGLHLPGFAPAPATVPTRLPQAPAQPGASLPPTSLTGPSGGLSAGTQSTLSGTAPVASPTGTVHRNVPTQTPSHSPKRH